MVRDLDGEDLMRRKWKGTSYRLLYLPSQGFSQSCCRLWTGKLFQRWVGRVRVERGGGEVLRAWRGWAQVRQITIWWTSGRKKVPLSIQVTFGWDIRG